MARQAKGKGTMGKNSTPDCTVSAGATITNVSTNKRYTITAAIAVVISYVSNSTVFFTYDGANYSTNHNNITILD